MQIFKFGGASVRDSQAIRNVAHIVSMTGHRPLAIVISAMGKTTNALEAIIKAHYEQSTQLNELVDQLKNYHHAVCIELLGDNSDKLLAELHDLWVELEWIIEESPHPHYNYHYDQIIVFGELASTKIVSAYFHDQGIHHEWLDARGFIKTDASYREAVVDWNATQAAIDQIVKPSLKNHSIMITQGFIGSTQYNESTTLGREGSDYTAAILAYALDAESATIWKDVPGIMSGDPKLFPHAQLLSAISYQEAIEMTYYGAKVIHPKTIKPLQNRNIPLLVRPFDNPELYGTRISAITDTNLPAIIMVEPDQVLLQIATKDYSFIAEEHIRLMFEHIVRHRIKVNLMRNTAVSFLISVRNESDKLAGITADLNGVFDITTMPDLELITIRHADPATLEEVRNGKQIVLEEQFGGTHQMVVKVFG